MADEADRQSLLDTVGRWTYLKATGILAVAGILLACAGILASSVFDAASPFDISDPDSESRRAIDLHGELTGEGPSPEILLLVDLEKRGVVGAGAEKVADRLEAIRGVARVRAASGRSDVSDDGRYAVVSGFINPVRNSADVGERVAAELEDRPGVRLGGTAIAELETERRSENDLRSIELYAAPILLLLCFMVFRSFVAALLPVAIGGVAIILTLGLLRLATEVIEIDLFSLTMATALGTGLAIDYSLFMLVRYREELATGGSYLAAQLRTMRTAGHTVVFSALTIAASLAALTVLPVPFLRSTGIAGATVAILSGLAALIVLPAMFALLGPRVNPTLRKLGANSPATWDGIARRAVRIPSLTAGVAVLAMVLVGLPALGMELTMTDAKTLPPGDETRRVSQLLDKEFTRLPAAEITVLSPRGRGRQSDAVVKRLRDRSVVAVRGPVRLSSEWERLSIHSTAAPLSDAGQRLVEKVRRLRWPRGTVVTGRAAELADQRETLRSGLPLVLALLVGSTLGLVYLLTHSIALPFIALLANALTVAAALGIVVAIFQDGALAGLLGVDAPGAVDVSMPFIALAVVFGLSTDYGIFIFSRMAETRRRGASARDSLIQGMARTGPTVTAAAGLFSVAAGAFVFSDLLVVKEVAIAMAAGVILDATIVRVLLVPGLLGALGERWGRADRGRPSVEVRPRRS